MFHRRLVLLLSVFAIITIVMSTQMVRLSVVEGAERLAIAESRLDNHTFLPTHRGRILDRHQRILAIDRACYDVAVHYSVITGQWSRSKAYAQARKEIGRSKWGTMSPHQREVEVKARIGEWDAACEQLWSEVCRLGRISHEDLSQRLDAIRASVQSMAAVVWEQHRQRERERLGLADDAEFEFRAQPILEQSQPHVILPRVADEAAIEFKRLAEQMPGMLVVQNSHRREYPWLNAEVPLPRASLPRQIRRDDPMVVGAIGVADHILGAVRDEIWEADVQRRPFEDKAGKVIDLGGYKSGDVVGSRGVERVFEDQLRGLRGEIRERKDTGEQKRIEALPGKDLHLTLDIALQARVQALLSQQFGLTRVQPWHNNTLLPLGTPLNSAAVVIEVETGEILAMVSMPTLAMGEQMTASQRAEGFPMVNRAAEAVYPPGSIIKPLVLCAAVSEGLHNLASPIACRGHYFDDPNSTGARCWIYRERYGMGNHGALQAAEAIARSCNIFFYTLADRLGIKRTIKWLGNFGLGQTLDVGLRYAVQTQEGQMHIGENAGSLPDEARITQLRRDGQLKFTEVIMGIGQGPMTWTPVQAANAYAMLARGGSVRDATIVMDDPRGTRAQRCDDLNLNSRLVATALDGLRQAVEVSFGTGHHINYSDGTQESIINAAGVTVWAKTGTAQAPPKRIDSNGDGVIDGKDQVIKDVDHSWFVGLVGPKGASRPLHAIAVIVEYGGSGGRCAGPIANQIIRALQAEGYLPGDANAANVSQSRRTQPEPEPDGGDE